MYSSTSATSDSINSISRGSAVACSRFSHPRWLGWPPKSRRIVISRIERARNIGADRSNKRRIGLFLSLLMAMARPGFISQSPVLKSIPFSSPPSPKTPSSFRYIRYQHTLALPLSLSFVNMGKKMYFVNFSSFSTVFFYTLSNNQFYP